MTNEIAIKAIQDFIGWFKEDSLIRKALEMAIKALSQEPKTGHWMKSNIGGAKVCSVCNAHMGLSSFKFCPSCGAKMQESEDKE